MTEPHAITRARERYGIELTVDDLNRMTASIAAGKAMKLGEQADGSARYALLHNDRAVIVVAKHIVLTVLPRNREGSRLPKGITAGAPKRPPKSSRRQW